MQLANYLFFTTSCEPALAFYTQCGLGRVVEMMRIGDKGMPVKNEKMRGKIMQAKFEGPGVLFYASDNNDAEPMPHRGGRGGNANHGGPRIMGASGLPSGGGDVYDPMKLG
jgi:PhnB protein